MVSSKLCGDYSSIGKMYPAIHSQGIQMPMISTMLGPSAAGHARLIYIYLKSNQVRRTGQCPEYWEARLSYGGSFVFIMQSLTPIKRGPIIPRVMECGYYQSLRQGWENYHHVPLTLFLLENTPQMPNSNSCKPANSNLGGVILLRVVVENTSK